MAPSLPAIKSKASKGKGKGKAVATSAAPTTMKSVQDEVVGGGEEEEEDSEDVFEGDEDESEDGDEDEDDDDDDEVDEAAMNKLMELLGDVDPYELGLEGDEEQEDDDDDDNEDDQESDGEEVHTDDDEEDDEEEEGDDDNDDEARDIAAEKARAAKPKTMAQKRQDEILDRILNRFKLDVDFFETQTLTFPDELEIPNVDDDLQRELQFYKQSLWAAQHAMKLFKASHKPFTRPDDYYAEMLKSDEHMEKIRQKLLDESAGIKASEAAKKQRHLKKFGKQVQVEKQREREKAKKEMNEKVKEFKKKRKANPGANDDDFDVEAELGGGHDSRPNKRARGGSSSSGARGRGRGGVKSRQQRDSKFGRPTTSRRPKENDRESTHGGFGGAGGRGGRGGARGGRGGRGGGAKRLGKSRRK